MAVQLDAINQSGDLTAPMKVGGAGTEKVLLTLEQWETLRDTSRNFVLLTPQDPNPAHEESKLFYEDRHKSLSYFTDVVGVTINVGQEMVLRVYNDTGAAISDGDAVRIIGSESTLGFPTVTLSIADTFENADVAGMATHDIPNETYGFITTSGVVHDQDMGLATAGESIYLSDTVAGAWTVTAPKIRTHLGHVVKEGATGALAVAIQISDSFPTTLGILSDKAGSSTITTAYANIAGYTTSEEYVVDTDITTGYVTPRYSGKYLVNINMVGGDFTVSSQSREVILQVWDVTAAAEVTMSTITIAKDGEFISRSLMEYIDVIANHDYVLRVSADATVVGVVYSKLAFAMQSVIL